MDACRVMQVVLSSSPRMAPSDTRELPFELSAKEWSDKGKSCLA